MASLDVVQVPPIHYAANDRGKLAYQDFGRGPALVIVPSDDWAEPADDAPLAAPAQLHRGTDAGPATLGAGQYLPHLGRSLAAAHHRARGQDVGAAVPAEVL